MNKPSPGKHPCCSHLHIILSECFIFSREHRALGIWREPVAVDWLWRFSTGSDCACKRPDVQNCAFVSANINKRTRSSTGERLQRWRFTAYLSVLLENCLSTKTTGCTEHKPTPSQLNGFCKSTEDESERKRRNRGRKDEDVISENQYL